MVNKTLFIKDWKTLKWNSLLFFFILFTVRIIPAYIHLYAYTHTKDAAQVIDPYTLWDIFRVNLLNVSLGHIIINVAFALITALILFFMILVIIPIPCWHLCLLVDKKSL